MEDRRNIFESDIRSIKESKLLLDENKKILLEFIEFKQSQEIVMSRLCRIAEGLRAVLSNLNKPLNEIDDKDVQSLLIDDSQLCKAANINKRIHLHLFRHTRMTKLAKILPEQTLKALAGWAAGSNMAQVIFI